MTGKQLRWGSHRNVADPVIATPGSLVEVVVLHAYLIAWSLTMAVYIGAFVLTGVVTLLLLLVWLPCFLWSKVPFAGKSRRLGRDPKARLLGSRRDTDNSGG